MVSIGSVSDRLHMTHAFKLSEYGLGYTEPNPLVGAVVVKNGRVIGSGFHGIFGGAHAEKSALDSVSQPGATLYVTLEPCSHFGKTPPCCDLIIYKKVSRVVVPVVDPNPLVNGAGIALLKSAGIIVEVGLMAERAEAVNRHYLLRYRKERPFFAVHAGMSVDGKMTDRNGAFRWLTDSEMRLFSHSLRGEFSAILVGRNTVATDNCRLTVRTDGWKEKKFFRVILDSDNSLPSFLHVFQDQEHSPLIIFSSTRALNRTPKCQLHYFLEPVDGQIPPALIASFLHELGVASVLIEGGGQVIDSFIRAGLVDEYYFFTSPRLVGGKPSVEPYCSGAASLAEALALREWRLIKMKEGWLLQGRS